LLVLISIGCCALINSAELRTGFPSGIDYDRVLAFDSQSGFRGGCMFIGYELDEDSAKQLLRSPRAERLVTMDRPGDRHLYTPYRETSALLTNGRDWAGADGKSRNLFALGAEGGCGDGAHALPYATELLTERGNLASVSGNGEGLSIISPARRLVLFLYFG
jgi:hypothetical protein